MSELIIDGVGRIFPGVRGGAPVTALQPTSLTVPANDFVTILGPSGCGKSTLLRMIAGLETITDGTVSIGDRVVNDIEPAGRDIAMVFQNYALYPHMSVRQNLAYGLKNRRTPAAEIARRVDEAAPASAGAVRAHPGPLAAFSPEMAAAERRLKAFLYARLYRDPRVARVTEPAAALLAALFEAVAADPQTRLPPEWAAALPAHEPERRRHIADYLSAIGHPTTPEQSMAEFMGYSGATYLVQEVCNALFDTLFHILPLARDMDKVEATPARRHTELPWDEAARQALDGVRRGFHKPIMSAGTGS